MRLAGPIPSNDTRDAIHAAVMQHHKIRELYSYDRDFDQIPVITRLEPQLSK